MPKKSKGAEALIRWKDGHHVTAVALSAELGDKGGQIGKWLTGSREKLPIRLIVALSQHTGIPLKTLAEPDQLQVAKDIFAVLARDAAA